MIVMGAADREMNTVLHKPPSPPPPAPNRSAPIVAGPGHGWTWT
jgi:hypothetical protein